MPASPKRQQRPFVVAEFVLSMMYHGRPWTVGCNTEEAAIRAFLNRVAGSDGDAIIAYERATCRPICWTDGIRDPVMALDYWVGGSNHASLHWAYDEKTKRVRRRRAARRS